MPPHESKLPTVVSFAAGAEYYQVQARRLQHACDRLGLRHSIEFLPELSELTWAELCRFKVRFFKKKLDELKEPILWVDADTNLLAAPTVLGSLGADFAAFPMSARLNQFNGYTIARMWRASFLYFGYTDASQAFVQHMIEVDEAAPENVTDAYVLQEAWATHAADMSVLVIPPKHIAKSADSANADTWIIDGHSGNVPKFRDTVVQHDSILNRGELLTAVAGDYLHRKEHAAAEAMLHAAQDYGYESAVHTRRLSQVLTRRGSRVEADDLIRRFAERHPADAEGRIMAAALALREHDFDVAAEMLRAAIALGGTAALQAQSMQVDLDLDRRAKQMGLDPEQRPAIWWMKHPYPGNLGDVLNPYIVEKVTGLPPRHVPADRGMLAIGSVIKFAGDGQHVWGSGTPRMTDQLNPRAIYDAVRGPLTRDLVQRSGGKSATVFGDPALLMPRFYAPTVTKKYQLGVIRHVSDRGMGVLDETVRDLNLLRVGYREMEQFVDELLECEFVISTSLHGLILANAYGIPARWAHFSDAAKPISGDGTKYIDYLRSVRLEDQTPLDLAQFPVLDDSLTRHVDPATAEIVFDAEALIEAFPTATR